MNKNADLNPLIVNESPKFRQDLQFSFDEGVKDYWVKLYSKYFVGYSHHIDNLEKNADQVAGIDTYIHLKNGKVITIDQKVRDSKFDDVALEFVSINEKNKPGWICDDSYRPDFIMYYIIPLKKCYLLPVPQLQLMWKVYGQRFIAKYGQKKVVNDNYTTLICCVPINIIYEGIKRCSVLVGKV